METNSSAVWATWIDPGPNSSGSPQRGRNGMSVVYGNTAVVESWHRGQMDGRYLEDMLDPDLRLRAGLIASRMRLPSLTVRNITSASADGEMTFGATPPPMSPIGVVCGAEHRVDRQRDRPQRHERVEQLVDGGFAELGKRRMCGAAGGAQPKTQDAARRERQADCPWARR